MSNENRYFLESNFVGLIRSFVFVYLNRNNHVKRYNAKMQYLPKSTINNYVIISGKNFYDQPIDSDIKRYK